MAMKEQPRQVYRTMQGKEVDMHKLMMQNELTPAVGNAKVNARGDELGPGGKIIRKREEVLQDTSGGVSVPDQINTRAVTQSKDVSDMDPEGDE